MTATPDAITMRVYSPHWVAAITDDTFALPDKYDGLKQLRPKLARMWWYRYVGLAREKDRHKPGKPSRAAQAAIRRNERKMEKAKMRLYVMPKAKAVA